MNKRKDDQAVAVFIGIFIVIVLLGVFGSA